MQTLIQQHNEDDDGDDDTKQPPSLKFVAMGLFQPDLTLSLYQFKPDEEEFEKLKVILHPNMAPPAAATASTSSDDGIGTHTLRDSGVTFILGGEEDEQGDGGGESRPQSEEKLTQSVLTTSTEGKLFLNKSVSELASGIGKVYSILYIIYYNIYFTQRSICIKL